jgi:hypothetical protein
MQQLSNRVSDWYEAVTELKKHVIPFWSVPNLHSGPTRDTIKGRYNEEFTRRQYRSGGISIV